MKYERVNGMDRCIVCNEEVDDYEPKYCCNSRDCDCMGRPIEPPMCDKKECTDKLFGK